MRLLIAGLSILSVTLPALSAGKPDGALKTYCNPILPGFHPDPSCIRVQEWDDTFFCATSSFNAVPGVPIFASKDLQHFCQIGEAYQWPSNIVTLAERTIIL